MDLSTIAVALVAIVVINYLYNHYITSTKDVNDMYLNDQSIVEATRLPQESAVYKSNKLDHSHGLRIGLDIRYDHYKIRHGNLCDIWQIVMSNLDKSSHIIIDNTKLNYNQLNYKVDIFSSYLTKNDIKDIKINLKFFLTNQDVLVAVLAGFLNQITVEFYDDFSYLVKVEESNQTSFENSIIVVDNQEQFSIQNLALNTYNFFNIENVHIYDSQSQDTNDTFQNEYNFTKDKGIALKLTRKINNKILSSVEYTQLNLISSVASTLKHLPLTKFIDSNDKIVIINDDSLSNEHLLNSLIKLLCGFISSSEITLIHPATELSWESIFKLNPSIVSISEYQLSKLSIQPFLNNLNFLSKFLFDQKLKFISNGKFSNFNYKNEDHDKIKNLRLIYVNKSLNSKPKILMTYYNKLRCLFSTRIIVESGYYNIVGPVILGDFYDYRLNNVSNLRSCGCISQSLEIKLVNLNGNTGNLMVRGYNIGKTTTWLIKNNEESNALEKYDENKSFMKLNNGFMSLNDVSGIWGNDGCLYVI